MTINLTPANPSTVVIPPAQAEVPPVEIVVPNFDAAIAEYGEAQVGNAQCLPLVLFSDYAEIDMGKGVKKQISHASLKEILDRSLNTVETSVDIKGMLLPSNVFFFSQTKNKIMFNVYYAGGNRNMIYGEQKLEIAAPNIIIAFTLKKDLDDWIVESAYYFCTDLPVSKLPKTFIGQISNKEGIYLLPMSNTYDQGNMCYGNNAMPARFKDNNFRGLDWYFRFLWETPFNNDLGIRAVGDRIGVSAWYKLLEKLAKEKKTFPYKDLRGWKKLEGSVESTSEIGDR
jgi:hypothetical protein